MSEVEILDDAILILYGEKTFTRYNVLATAIEDIDSFNFTDLHSDTSAYWSIEKVYGKPVILSCPQCKEEVRSWVRVICTIQENSIIQVLYCTKCNIIFRRVQIGWIDEEGDYHEQQPI
jgi:hypothetical protein